MHADGRDVPRPRSLRYEAPSFELTSPSTDRDPFPCTKRVLQDLRWGNVRRVRYIHLETTSRLEDASQLSQGRVGMCCAIQHTQYIGTPNTCIADRQ